MKRRSGLAPRDADRSGTRVRMAMSAAMDTLPPLTSSHSRDDLVTAADGGFTGKAVEY